MTGQIAGTRDEEDGKKQRKVKGRRCYPMTRSNPSAKEKKTRYLTYGFGQSVIDRECGTVCSCGVERRRIIVDKVCETTSD